jgi:RHS repeat-associated protein
LIGQKTGGDVMKFSDMGFVLNGVAYFYVKNLQGDVVKVVNNAGAVVASYSYDAWGSVISSSGDLAEVNPIRYRGYYFDVESGLYYLQSRYYNPNWGRFINADTVFAQLDVTDNNLYAYCGNDPIGYLDSEGMYRIREDRKRTVIIDKANEAYEAINWYEENRERYPIYIADYYYRDYQDGMAMAVFEIAAERAKTEYTFGIASQGYGIVQVAGEYTIISTSTEVMVISWGVAEVAIADFGKAVYSLAKDASTSFWTIFGGLIGGAILTGMNDDEGDNSALQMSDGALVGRMSLYDELNQIFKDIKNNSSYDELIIWLNYDAIYGKDKSHHFGKNLTAFWKYIFG